MCPGGKEREQMASPALHQDVNVEYSERKVLEALEDQRWDFRTVDGIAAETGLPESFVSDTLRRYPNYVRVSPIPDRCGRVLFTLRDRPKKNREIFSELRAFLAGSSR
jgi:hypothetical protein